MTQQTFHWLVFLSILTFPTITFFLHLHAARRTEVDGFNLIQLGFAGATFPTFVLLLSLVAPEVREVLADQDVFLALAGFAGAVMTLRSLFPGPLAGG